MNKMISTRRHTKVPSPLGELTLVRAGDQLIGVYFEHHWYRPPTASFGPRVDDGFDGIVEQLSEYFAGERRGFDIPTQLLGTPQQTAAWSVVGDIPYGATTTYGALGRQLGIPARDVGALIGRNPLCVVVPCHRVIGASGNLTGYAGGLARKRTLLELEHALPAVSEQLQLAIA